MHLVCRAELLAEVFLELCYHPVDVGLVPANRVGPEAGVPVGQGGQADQNIGVSELRAPARDVLTNERHGQPDSRKRREVRNLAATAP